MIKYLQTFEATRHPWTGEPRIYFILWSEDGQMLDHGEGKPPQADPGDRIIPIRRKMRIKMRDFERTVALS